MNSEYEHYSGQKNYKAETGFYEPSEYQTALSAVTDDKTQQKKHRNAEKYRSQ
jgi:hypothetical protein